MTPFLGPNFGQKFRLPRNLRAFEFSLITAEIVGVPKYNNLNCHY